MQNMHVKCKELLKMHYGHSRRMNEQVSTLWWSVTECHINVGFYGNGVRLWWYVADKASLGAINLQHDGSIPSW